ncbi:hypothetical protein CWE15_11045 [Aliidiomarina taiwanensis]|uniref:Uncharacterized protein n=1 Tax=Aliidiomarina taiwanensis TaxID=946228 RepID=A0A432WVW1_9GAMM|nr:hypothetical protein CWE15_11045 [Aliidiomarina taiwanensis]
MVELEKRYVMSTKAVPVVLPMLEEDSQKLLIIQGIEGAVRLQRLHIENVIRTTVKASSRERLYSIMVSQQHSTLLLTHIYDLC